MEHSQASTRQPAANPDGASRRRIFRSRSHYTETVIRGAFEELTRTQAGILIGRGIGPRRGTHVNRFPRFVRMDALDAWRKLWMAGGGCRDDRDLLDEYDAQSAGLG